MGAGSFPNKRILETIHEIPACIHILVLKNKEKQNCRRNHRIACFIHLLEGIEIKIKKPRLKAQALLRGWLLTGFYF